METMTAAIAALLSVTPAQVAEPGSMVETYEMEGVQVTEVYTASTPNLKAAADMVEFHDGKMVAMHHRPAGANYWLLINGQTFDGGYEE